VAYLISHILSDPVARAPAFGLNSLLEIPGHTVAVKTGTSDDKKDNWCFGYTPDYVVGAWVGNNDKSPMDPQLTSGITGATPIWHDIMTTLLAEKPDLTFSRPPGIIETIVDGRRDLAISGVSPKSVIALKKSMKKDEATGGDKETTTYSDQFSSFNPDQNKIIQ
jgi:membrane carboxypeptidase/penicillin-binding protein